MFSYTVRCEFQDASVATKWMDWLQQEHIQDVLDAGAESAAIFRMDNDVLTYEIRYVFRGRQEFELYEKEHAPRLRAEGLSRFPLEWGLNYSRTSGEIVHPAAE